MSTLDLDKSGPSDDNVAVQFKAQGRMVQDGERAAIVAATDCFCRLSSSPLLAAKHVTQTGEPFDAGLVAKQHQDIK